MKWHRIVVNGLVSGLVVDMWNIHNVLGQVVVLVILVTLLAVLGKYEDENK